jgi:hypothetical protein
MPPGHRAGPAPGEEALTAGADRIGRVAKGVSTGASRFARECRRSDVTDRGADRSFSATTEGGSASAVLALAAGAGFMHAAQLLKSDGSFAGLAGLAPYSEVNDFVAADFRARQTGVF